MGRIQRVSMADLRANPPTPVHTLWGDGLVIKPSLVHIGAEQKVGKSLFAKQFLKNLVDPTVHEWLGFRIQTVDKVLYMNEEVPQSGVYNRMRIMYGSVGQAWESKFIIPPDRGVRLDSDPQLFWDIMDEERPDVVCIDPLDRYHTLDTGSNQQMGMFLDRLWTAGRSFNAVVIFVHHWNKEGIGDMRSVFTRARGAGRLTSDPDSIFMLQRMPEGRVQLDAQLRHSEWDGPILLRRNRFMVYVREDES